jgi:hypothetical protein
VLQPRADGVEATLEDSAPPAQRQRSVRFSAALSASGGFASWGVFESSNVDLRCAQTCFRRGSLGTFDLALSGGVRFGNDVSFRLAQGVLLSIPAGGIAGGVQVRGVLVAELAWNMGEHFGMSLGALGGLNFSGGSGRLGPVLGATFTPFSWRTGVVRVTVPIGVMWSSATEGAAYLDGTVWPRTGDNVTTVTAGLQLMLEP